MKTKIRKNKKRILTWKKLNEQKERKKNKRTRHVKNDMREEEKEILEKRMKCKRIK